MIALGAFALVIVLGECWRIGKFKGALHACKFIPNFLQVLRGGALNRCYSHASA
jgi:hypothetical protein